MNKANNYLETLKMTRDDLDRKNNLVTLKEQAEKLKISKENEHIQQLYETMNRFEMQKQQKIKYRNDIRNSLLHEFFSTVMESCTNKLLYKEYKPLINNLVESYISEKGATTILNSFNSKTLFLDESKKKIEATTKELLDDTEEIEQGTKGQDSTKDDDTDNIVYDSMDFDISNKFRNAINNADMEDIGDAIKTKVNNSVENFLVSNAADKEKIKDIIDKTQAKIDKTENDKVSEAYEMQCKSQITSIKNKNKKSLLEHMIYNTIKSALTDDKLKSIYVNENGRLNMDRIVEENEVVYTFLEMLNTTRIEKIDESFLESFVN